MKGMANRQKRFVVAKKIWVKPKPPSEHKMPSKRSRGPDIVGGKPNRNAPPRS
jgi:hypothetical protein